MGTPRFTGEPPASASRRVESGKRATAITLIETRSLLSSFAWKLFHVRCSMSTQPRYEIHLESRTEHTGSDKTRARVLATAGTWPREGAHAIVPSQKP